MFLWWPSRLGLGRRSVSDSESTSVSQTLVVVVFARSWKCERERGRRQRKKKNYFSFFLIRKQIKGRAINFRTIFCVNWFFMFSSPIHRFDFVSLSCGGVSRFPLPLSVSQSVVVLSSLLRNEPFLEWWCLLGLSVFFFFCLWEQSNVNRFTENWVFTIFWWQTPCSGELLAVLFSGDVSGDSVLKWLPEWRDWWRRRLERLNINFTRRAADCED